MFASLLGVEFSPARVDPHVASEDPARLRQPLLERSEPSLPFRIVRACRPEHADAPHPLRLLRARRERPCRCRATDERDELTPVHSITSSARSHSGRPPNMNTTPAQLEAPRPTPPRYLV